jgi:hypothetical protein
VYAGRAVPCHPVVPDVEAQDYRADIRLPFGSGLELPAPFSFTLTDFTPRAD